MGGAGADKQSMNQSSVSTNVQNSLGFQDAFTSAWTNSANRAQSSSAANTFVDPNQQSRSTGLWDLGAQYANPAATTAAAQGASAANAPLLGAAAGNLSGLTDPQGQIRAQEASLRSGLGNLLRTEILPQIGRDARVSGGFGGGRQGVAEGVAGGEIADAYTAALGDITARANQTAIGAAGMLPQLTQTRMANAVAPSMAGLDPLSRLAQIIGAPTVLSTSRGGSTSTGSSRSRQTSSSRGRTKSHGKSTSLSAGASSGSGWRFGLGKG